MKQLETEYKNQISLETPDLWSRIEAGIDKYESEQKENALSSPISEKSKGNAVNFKTRKIVYTIGRITAAAICVLAIGATVNYFRGGRKYSASFDMAKSMDSTPAAAATETATEYTCIEEAEAETDEYSNGSAANTTYEEAAISPESEAIEKSVEQSETKYTTLDELFHIDYEGQLTEQLNELGFTNISDLTYQKLNVTRSSNIYTGSFINEDTGDKCSVDYIISIETIEIVEILKLPDKEILYQKDFD